MEWIDLTRNMYKWRAAVNMLMNIRVLRVISGFRRKVDKNYAILGYYAASSDNFLLTFSGQPIGPIFRGRESRWDR